MRRALSLIFLAIALCPPCAAADRRSWNHIRYIGGTVQVKASRYDWNTTLSVTADAIIVEIAPATVFTNKKTVRIQPSQVLSLGSDEAAWRRVAAVGGAIIPAKQPALFGMLRDFDYLGLIYQTEDGKRGAMLLESVFSGHILQVLSRLTGKPIENAP
jgi:hypothetical protein